MMKSTLATLAAGVSASLFAQGTFENLDFESATLTPIPAGQYGGFVPISEALPNWFGDLGNNPVTQVLQNNLTLGDASIDILGPDWNSGQIIEGQYTVVLQGGVIPGNPQFQTETASISQTAVVPANSESLEFEASIHSSFSISLGGQYLTATAWGTGANYTLYAANIPSADAGQLETLTITSLATDATPDYFDAFAFSPTTIPEPNPMVLAGIGGLLFALRRQVAPSPRLRRTWTLPWYNNLLRVSQALRG